PLPTLRLRWRSPRGAAPRGSSHRAPLPARRAQAACSRGVLSSNARRSAAGCGRTSSRSSALPGNRGAQRSDVMIELLAGVQLGDGGEEIVGAAFEETGERYPTEDLLVLEIGEDLGSRERRADHELVVNRAGERQLHSSDFAQFRAEVVRLLHRLQRDFAQAFLAEKREIHVRGERD